MGKLKKKNKGGGGTKLKSKLGKKRNSNKGKNMTPPTVTLEASKKQEVQNPFEIRTFRPKHDNLGRRARWEKGVPGVSRSKAIEKRKETLLKEYQVRNKTNLLVDKRIGEKIKNMSEEEKIARRSVMEKKRQYKQKSIFNLPSTDDILTHKGQILTDIDRYEDPRDETDSEDERLNEEFVSDAHFAGDFLKYKKPDEPDPDEHKSRKDIIAELILNSKQRKLEKAKEADETYELVSKLDQEFKTPDFRNLLNFVKKGVNEPEAPPKKEDYDKIVRELHFEAKTGLATNRLKTEEEIQEEELTNLKKLEKERLKRMKAQDPTVATHRSADDLGDDFDMEDDVPALSYKEDGELMQDASEGEEEEDEDDGEEEEELEVENQDQDASDNEAEDSGSESDDFSDFQSDEDIESEDKSTHNEQISMQDTSTILENDDIPFTIPLPKTYDGFKKLMVRYRAEVKEGEIFMTRFEIVLERLVKYSLLAEKQRIPQLFVYILKFVAEGINVAGVISDYINRIVETTACHLHSLLVTNPEKCVELLEENILQQYLSFGKGNKLSLSKIALFRIFSRIFCVTDFCHKILSPMKVNILELINGSCSSYMELLKLLALVDVLFDVSHESKRYCPEVVKLLVDILEAFSLPIDKLRFKRRRFEFLRINNLERSRWSGAFAESPGILRDSEVESPSEDQILSLILRVFEFLSKFIDCQHRTRPFSQLKFKILKTQLFLLNLKWTDKNFHKELFSRKIGKECLTSSQGEKEKDDLGSSLIDRPKMLKLYDPVIEDNFDGNKRKKLKRKGMSQEAAKLSHKVKKEMKSAYREMLKDNAFLAKQQMKEQAMKDAERNRRVKEILGGLANQEGDYRKFKK